MGLDCLQPKVELQFYVPGGLVGGSRGHQDQLLEFKSHRVHARRCLFLHKKTEIPWWKARERELATFDGNSRAMGKLNPMRDKKERPVPGGRRVDACGHGLSRSPLTVKHPTSYRMERRSDDKTNALDVRSRAPLLCVLLPPSPHYRSRRDTSYADTTTPSSKFVNSRLPHSFAKLQVKDVR